ncbi:MAG: zinc-binding dehydrogenase [bacterium]|nr:zinc-binding dehydrogenase [bacterium]
MTTEGYFLVKKGDANQAFELRSLELPAVKANEVVVEVEAFGLNYADVMARNGLYRGAPPMPCVLGYEAVGTIVEVGSDVQSDLLGRRVMAFCRFGAYSRHVVTMDFAVVPVGEEDAVELLALCTQGVTAYYMAEHLAPVHENDIVLVHAAAGGVGTLLIQMAKRRGAAVIAKVGRSEKEALVKELGADHVVNYRTGDYAEQVRKVLNGKKLDVSFNPAGGSTFKKDMSLLGADGRMFVFGGSELSGAKWGILSAISFVFKMGRVMPVMLMGKSKSILGVNMLEIADSKPEVMKRCLNEVVKMYQSGALKPQSGGMFPEDQLAEAHALLESGKSTGKIGVSINKK